MTEYFVSKGEESLTAILNEITPPEFLKAVGIREWTPELSKRSVELRYQDANGITTVLVIANKTIASAASIDQKGRKYNFPAFGFQPRVAELMQELKPQIPQEWYSVLGNWIDAQTNGQKTE